MKLRRATLVCGGVLAFASNAAAAVTFSSTNYHIGFVAIVSGDFNRDGKPDLVTLNSGSFSFLAGVGDGTFLPPTTTELGALTTDIPSSIAAADVNLDGALDLAIGYSFQSGGFTYSSTITIHLGDGTGHFSGLAMTSGEDPVSLAVGDFTHDGTPDLVVAAAADDYAVWIHPGNGDGTFQPPFPRSTFTYRPAEVIAADLDGNGRLDVIVAGSGSDGVALITWLDAGVPPGYPLVRPASSWFQNIHLTSGDLNGDDYPDVVLNTWTGGGFGAIGGNTEVFIGGADGVLRSRGTANIYGVGRAVLADFNTDGYLDAAGGGVVLVGTFPLKTLGVSLGNGHGEFSLSPDIPEGWPVLADDFNGDGRPDLVGGWDGFGGELIVLINTSPYGCVDRVNLSYAAGALGIGFTITSLTPTTWSTWIAFQNWFIPLWSLPIPAVPAEVSFTVPVPGFPQVGNVAVLTTMNSPAYGLMCGDWKVVDTGGIGPIAESSP